MHGDLGADTGTVALNLGAKAIEALLNAIKSLLNTIYTIWREHPQRKMTKKNLQEAKTRADKIKIIKKMTGVDGYVRAKRLEKYCNAVGANVVVRTINFANERQKEAFKELCSKHGLAWSAVKNNTDGLEIKILYSDRDQQLLQKIIDECYDMQKIRVADEKIDSILNGRNYEDCSEIDKKNIDLLNAEKSSLQAKWTTNFNIESYNQALDDVLFSHGENEKYEAQQISFEYESFDDETFAKKDAFSACLDAHTGRELDKDRYSVMVSMNEPDRFIICHGESNPDKEALQKIITTYEVHNANGNTKVFSDAPNDKVSWKDVKESMRAFGGFGSKGSGEVYLRFNNVEEFNKWQSLAKTQRENESIRVRNDSELQNAIAERTEELKSKGFEIREDGEVYDMAENRKASDIAEEYKATEKKMVDIADKKGEPIDVAKSLDIKENRANLTEAILIGREIANYHKLIEVNTNLAMAKTNLAVAEISGNKQDIAKAQEDISFYENWHEKYTEEKELIVGERNKINGVQADVQRQKLDYTYALTNAEKSKVNDMAVSYETLHVGKSEDFNAKVLNSAGKDRVVALSELAREVTKKGQELEAKGEDVSKYIELGNAIYQMQNKELQKVKIEEPEVFKTYMNEKCKDMFRMQDGEISKLNEIASEYEKLGLGNAQELISAVTEKYGNARVAELSKRGMEVAFASHKLEAEGKDTVAYNQLEKYIGDLTKGEYDRMRTIQNEDTIIYGNKEEYAIEDSRAEKQKSMNDYNVEIDNIKKKETIGKDSFENANNNIRNNSNRQR